MSKRAAARAACLILAAGLAGSVPARAEEAPPRDPAPVRTAPFPDVPRDHWAYDAVEQLRKRGILRGYPPAPAAVKQPGSRTSKKPARQGKRR